MLPETAGGPPEQQPFSILSHHNGGALDPRGLSAGGFDGKLFGIPGVPRAAQAAQGT